MISDKQSNNNTIISRAHAVKTKTSNWRQKEEREKRLTKNKNDEENMKYTKLDLAERNVDNQ